MSRFLQEMSGNKWQSKDEAVGGPRAWCHTLTGFSAGIRFCLVIGPELYRTNEPNGFDETKKRYERKHVFQMLTQIAMRAIFMATSWHHREKSQRKITEKNHREKSIERSIERLLVSKRSIYIGPQRCWRVWSASDGTIVSATSTYALRFLSLNSLRGAVASPSSSRRCLGVPVTEHSYEDTVLMEEGRKHGLPAAACIIEFKAVARRLG